MSVAAKGLPQESGGCQKFSVLALGRGSLMVGSVFDFKVCRFLIQRAVSWMW